MNQIFVANKPTGISSNHFLSSLKRKYNQKKAGFTGTLDPFASGVLVVGFGAHTKLFRFLDKTPKRYRATLWLGAYSKSLDIERVESIRKTHELNQQNIKDSIDSLQGALTYSPPSFSAKRINGKRAYELARDDIDVKLKQITSNIYQAKLITYSHPFVTFEVTVSEGTYIRSLGEILADRLGIKHASLSSLTRLSEGKFTYNQEEPIDIKQSLNVPKNNYNADINNILLGKVLSIGNFDKKADGYYWLDNNDTITIIKITGSDVTYELNKVPLC